MILVAILVLTTLAIGADPRDILATGTPEEIKSQLGSIRNALERDAFHWTPLMLAAAQNHHPEVIVLLLEQGENREARSLDDWDALMFAAAFNPNRDVLAALLEAGADPDRRTRDAWVAGYGVARFTGGMVQFDGLGLFQEAAPEEEREYGWSALFFAARYNDSPGVLEELLLAGADPRLRDEHGLTALDYIVQAGQGRGEFRKLLEVWTPPE